MSSPVGRHPGSLTHQVEEVEQMVEKALAKTQQLGRCAEWMQNGSRVLKGHYMSGACGWDRWLMDVDGICRCFKHFAS